MEFLNFDFEGHSKTKYSNSVIASHCQKYDINRKIIVVD